MSTGEKTARRRSDLVLAKIKAEGSPDSPFYITIIEMLLDIQEELAEIHGNVDNLKREIDSNKRELYDAFLIDDTGKPDLSGHRRAHKISKEDAEKMDEYKADVAKKIVISALTFIGGVLAVALVEYAKNQLK